MRRSTRAVLAVVATLLFASACGDVGASGSGAAITFNIAVEDSELPAIEELLRRFQQTTGSKVGLSLVARGRNRPGPRINLSRLNATDMTTALKKGRPGVDLIAVDNQSLGPLLEDGLVQELRDVRVPDDVVVAMRSEVSFSQDGACKRYFLPFRPNVRLTYVRKEALEAAGLTDDLPRTLGELEDTAQALRDKPLDGPGRPVVTLSLAPGDATAVTLAEWIVSYGGDPLTLNDPTTLEALRHLERLWRQDIFSRASLGARYDTEPDFLLSRHAHLAQNWTFTSAKLAEAGQLDRFDVYEGWRGPAKEAHVIGGDLLAIPSGVEGARYETAVALAQFLMSREAQAYLAQENAWPSIRRDVNESVPPAQEDTFVAIRAALANGWLRPPVAHWEEVVVQMNAVVDRILIGREDAKAVVDQLQAHLDSYSGPSQTKSARFC